MTPPERPVVVAEHVVKDLVSGFGVAVPRGATTPAAEDVAAAASGLTPPLVVKAYGPGLVHKSDAGAVRLGLGSPVEAARAAAEIRTALVASGVAIEGYLVEEQAPPGVEVIVGAVRDPSFGPVILAGLGGVWTEVLRDTALRLCPITEDDARDMLAELRGAALLDGLRGSPAADRNALVKVLLAVGGPGGVVESLGDGFTEFELNPVICTPEGAVAVDARLLRPSPPPADAHLPRPFPPTAGARPPSPSPAERAGRRGLQDGPQDFTRLFAPRGVAVVGASAKRPNFGNMFLAFYRAAGYSGRLVAVHPTAGEIDGVPCVPTLAGAGVDYALVAVPAERCPDVVREARGVPFVQVMSGGFREAGAVDLEEDLAAAAREAGVRLLGPNCMGVYSPAGGQTFIGGRPGPPGRIALISQSGGLAGEVVRVGERRGLAFSKVATVGNSADVGPAELLRHLADDDGTSVIGLYLEDPRDGRALFEALRAVTKPVVALVGGRSAQGHRAAASHTGAMVGDARIWTALARQTGLPLVTAQDDLIGALDLLDLHAGRDVPASADVLVVGPSGGAGVLAADALDRAGLRLAPLPDVDLGLPVGAVPGNPLEIPVGPRGRPDLVGRVVTAIQRAARRPYPDVLTHVNVQSFFTFGDSADPLLAYAHAVGELQRGLTRTRVTLVLRNAEYAPPGVEDELRAIARSAGVPTYRSIEAAATAVAAAKVRDQRREREV
ncbi:acetate--CoA ligase family protein [Actinoallomurus rhizosphaericola]|uniref:acetate--CoA ligase family protein n=1 Tax=Actinoallomurus rhizosphaericola TaxID=2952536 RepID=UPI00209082A8|nr:acetate--CoA ligase family protein [Actinoallomurus rhizosphaericola]MCO5992249.1 acetate--CoA ligase family protein [Actinoallomurus rhizosphaericola]